MLTLFRDFSVTGVALYFQQRIKYFMTLNKSGVLALLGIVLVAVAIAALVLPHTLPEISEGKVAHVLTRIFALFGFLFLGVATIITPFLTEVAKAFGRPFLRVHHVLAAVGIALITLHPVLNAIDRLSLLVFIPVFESWLGFWTFAGRPAFIIFYVALVASLLRSRVPQYWRPFHAMMYVVLLFGIVHANLLGEDLQNLGIMIILNLLFVASIASFAYRLYRNYQTKKKFEKLRQQKAAN